MQQSLVKLALAVSSAFFLISCQKNIDSSPGHQSLLAAARNIKPQKLSGKLLTTIKASDGQVLTTFKYDNKKRLIEGKADGVRITYSYRNDVLTVKKVYEPTNTTWLLLTGKLNAKGFLTEARGSIKNGDVVSNVKIVYNYDQNGHLVKETYSSDDSGNLEMEAVYTWTGDNLTKISYQYNGVESTSITYEYDLAKINRMGIYAAVNYEWTDGFLGTPSLNLVAKTTYWQGPIAKGSRSDQWTLDAQGYPVSGIVSNNDLDGILYYHYNR